MLDELSRTLERIFAEAGRDGKAVRYRAEGTVLGGIVDLEGVGGFLPARLGRGSVHHLAFRAADDAAEMEMARRLTENHGIRTTEQKDRDYFRSIANEGCVFVDVKGIFREMRETFTYWSL